MVNKEIYHLPKPLGESPGGGRKTQKSKRGEK
jgi:hypothetical protein